METEKLYYADPFLQEFTATVLSCEATKGGFAVTLDRTASAVRRRLKKLGLLQYAHGD